MASVLVTGANGFIGQRLCQELADCGADVRRAVRNTVPSARMDKLHVIGDIDANTVWAVLFPKTKVT
jgi:uncharacterized protein YbjT (DUF2867 family)